jgi:hypothetical protein
VRNNPVSPSTEVPTALPMRRPGVPEGRKAGGGRCLGRVGEGKEGTGKA